ncbi:hypothetical protein [Oleiphilus messinensis]|nr:hypothetical protein [Oleiphilus messinensis]
MMATIVQKQWTLDDRPCFKVLHKDVEAEKTGAFNVSFYIPVK